MTKAEKIGKKVLAGLAKAHAKAAALVQDRVRARAEEVLHLAAIDLAQGKPAWGRAGRIARKLGGIMTERHVGRYLDRLSGMSDSGGYGVEHLTTPGGSPNV